MFLWTAVFSVSQVYSEETDQLNQWRQAPSAFQIPIKGNNPNGSATAQSTMIVDGVAEFPLENPPGASEDTLYDLYFFRDGLLDEEIKSIQLPYVFKQNFAGLDNGTYQLQFMLVNRLGEVGRVNQTITVRHHP